MLYSNVQVLVHVVSALLHKYYDTMHGTYHILDRFHSKCCPPDRLDDHLPLDQSPDYMCILPWS